MAFSPERDELLDELDELINAADRERPIDQIYCRDCGRPMVIWADVPLREDGDRCGRCRSGLAPEWEY